MKNDRDTLEFLSIVYGGCRLFTGLLAHNDTSYLNAGLYLNDLYNLVKRKSKAETFSLMAIPGVFAVLFVSVLSIFAHVPNLQSTASQAKRLSLIITTTQPQTNLALLLIVFLYPILWGIGL